MTVSSFCRLTVPLMATVRREQELEAHVRPVDLRIADVEVGERDLRPAGGAGELLAGHGVVRGGRAARAAGVRKFAMMTSGLMNFLKFER